MWTKRMIKLGLVLGVATRGDNFRLSIDTDGTPIDGGSHAEVVAEAQDGSRVSEELVCHFMR